MDTIIDATLQHSGNFTLKCEESGADHCKDIQVFGSVLDTNSKFGNFEVHCDGNVRSCIHAKIQCPVKGDCHIGCDSESSCQWSKIQGPKYGGTLSVDCNGVMSCSDATINAFESSQLSITGCTAYESCIDLTLYCPPNTGSVEPGSKRCFIAGNDNLGQDNEDGTIIYAMNGWNDVDIDYNGAYKRHGGKMHCGRSLEFSCNLTADAWSCVDANDMCNDIQINLANNNNNNNNMSANATQIQTTAMYTHSSTEATQMYTSTTSMYTTIADDNHVSNNVVSSSYNDGDGVWSSVTVRAVFGMGVVGTLVFVGCYCYCNSRRKRRLKAIKGKPAKEKKTKKNKSTKKGKKKSKKRTKGKIDVDDDLPSSSHDELVVHKRYKPDIDIDHSDSDTRTYPNTHTGRKSIATPKTNTENGGSLPGERALAEHVIVAMSNHDEGDRKRRSIDQRPRYKHSGHGHGHRSSRKQSASSFRGRYLSDDLMHQQHGDRMDTNTALQLLAMRKAMVVESRKNTYPNNEYTHTHTRRGHHSHVPHQRTWSSKKILNRDRYGSPPPRSKSSKSDKYGAYTEMTSPMDEDDQITIGHCATELSQSEHSTESVELKRYNFPHVESICGDTTVGNKTDIIPMSNGKDLNCSNVGRDAKLEMFTPHSLSRDQKHAFSFGAEMANPVNELPTTAPSRTCLTPSMSKRENDD